MVIRRNPLVVAPQTEVVLPVIAHLGLESIPWPLQALLESQSSKFKATTFF
jgi:hypothetical protein